MNLILVRHGQVPDDTNSSLTEKGKEQTRLLANKLKESKIDKIYCSKLKRSIETAEIIAKEVNAPVEENEKLNEIKQEIVFFPKEEWTQDHSTRLKILESFLDELENKHRNETILISGHGQINRAIIGMLTNIELDKTGLIQQRHACLNKLTWQKVAFVEKYAWRIVVANETSFLPGELITIRNIDDNLYDKGIF